MPGRIFVVAAIGVATGACGGSATVPAAQPSISSEPVPSDEQTLARALEKKRAGDPIGAWKLIENFSVSSPARLDPRYTEIMSAWADARAHEVGAEITGSKGGGPPVGTIEAAEEPLRTLSHERLDDIVASKRAKLRLSCFGNSESRTSFLLEIRIDTEGHVLEATTKEVKGDTSVAECVRSQAAGWVFPRNTEGAQHATRFIFAR